MPSEHRPNYRPILREILDSQPIKRPRMAFATVQAYPLRVPVVLPKNSFPTPPRHRFANLGNLRRGKRSNRVRSIPQPHGSSHLHHFSPVPPPARQQLPSAEVPHPSNRHPLRACTRHAGPRWLHPTPQPPARPRGSTARSGVRTQARFRYSNRDRAQSPTELALAAHRRIVCGSSQPFRPISHRSGTNQFSVPLPYRRCHTQLTTHPAPSAASARPAASACK